MIVNFAGIDLDERPVLILKKADDTPIGVLGNATNVEFEPKYNEVSVLTFTLPAVVDGVDTPFYNDVVGHRIIELKDIGQFVITNPEETGGKLDRKLQVTAESLEREFVKKKISLPESTYRFFDGTGNTDGTILGMIMELMPNWSVGSVSSSLYNKYRTYSVDNENLYNLIKGNIQKAYNCIFDFDTLNRVVSVRDADETPSDKQVYISRDNLAKDISVTENPDDMVTRLDVNGADGISIREVNPTGDNVIVDLSYFMNTDNFPQSLIDKYNAWKTLIENSKLPFYNYVVQYAALVTEEIAETAKLTDLKGEYTALENTQAVIIQGIAEEIRTQEDLDEINSELAAKQAEVEAKEAEIAGIQSDREDVFASITGIRDECAYESYFTLQERMQMDVYIFDNAITESTFVASEVKSYSDGAGNSISDKTISISGAEITSAEIASGGIVHSITGGTLNIPGIISGNIIRAVAERRSSGKVIISVYMAGGTYEETEFPSACISIAGSGSLSAQNTSITYSVIDAYLYFSLNASDYEKKSVAWDLYEYGEDMLSKMSSPSYSFSVNSANFIALEEFAAFKNELQLGQRLYIEVRNGTILRPICTGARISWADKKSLTLYFTDTFTATDGASKLIEILDSSVSMGKKLESGQYTYEAWTESGASTMLHEFIVSALDTAKNAIISSSEQAVSWDGAGLRLRRYADNAHTAYEPEQIWMSNNSIMLTDDSWTTAKMAIGKFNDSNLGEMWGIIAPTVVGTLLAGESLVIESQKKSGEVSVFKMDADGCRLYNSDFTIQKTNSNGTTTQILMNPDIGIAMGNYPVVSDNAINTNNARFWVDTNGNMHLAGTINSADGLIGNWNISPNGLWSGSGSTYVALSSAGEYRIWAGNETASDAPFYVKQDGTLNASKGAIGGWYIGSDYIGNADQKTTSTVGMVSGTGNKAVFWAGGSSPTTSNISPFMVTGGGAVYASNITATGGQVGGWYIGSDFIGNASKKNTSTVGMVSGTGTSVVFWAGGGYSDAKAFSVDGNGKVDAGNLNISGGSITIKSGTNTVFSVSNSGYLTAKSGVVGGWYIGSDYIGNANTSANSTEGLTSKSDAVAALWFGKKSPTVSKPAPFMVTPAGKMYATGAEISGTINATEGQLGGWYLSDDHIGSSATKNTSLVGLSNKTGKNTVLWAGNSGSDPSTASFRVTGNGAIHASEMHITGGTIDITNNQVLTFKVASTGAVTASNITITGGSITIKDTSNNTMFSVSDTGYLTAKSGVVGGWYIGSDYIGNASTKADSTIGMAVATGKNPVFWSGTDKFQVLANGTLISKNISITGGSIEIRNSKDEINFSVTANGVVTANNATVYGEIHARSLYIGSEDTSISSYLDGKGYRLEADHTSFMTEYFGVNGIYTKKTQFLQDNGHLQLDAITETNGGVTTRAGIRIDSNGKLILDASNLVSIGSSDNGIYITPTSIKINATSGSFVLNSDYTTITSKGSLTTTKGTIGGWDIGEYRFSSGSSSGSYRGYVALDSDSTLTNPSSSWNESTNDWVQPYALWCGASDPTSTNAKFKVRRDGTVYINALMVWDTDHYVKVDFSKDFADAVSLSSGGSWSGNTFNATLRFFNGAITKSVGISASVEVTDAYVVRNGGHTGDETQGTVELELSINGKTKTVTCNDIYIDATPTFEAGVESANNAYTFLGKRELFYVDHGSYESVGDHNWYYK